MSDSQTQSQSQSVQISVQSAGDVELERRIFLEVSSVGRQLGILSDALAQVLSALHDTPGFGAGHETPEVQRFRTLQTEIEKQKLARERERLAAPERLVQVLSQLYESDPAAYERYHSQLGAWLNAAPQPRAAAADATPR